MPSASDGLDEIDEGIINLLQRDARNLVPSEMAQRLPVSKGTVRNRIDKLEASGVLEGYVPVVNYEPAGYPLQMLYICSAPIADRETLARRALDVTGVINVRELMTGRSNVHVIAITDSTERVTEIAHALDELGLTIEDEELVRREYVRPFDHFGDAVVEDSDADGPSAHESNEE